MTIEAVNRLRSVLNIHAKFISENPDLDYTTAYYKKDDKNIYLYYENYNPNIVLSLKISNNKDIFVDFYSDLQLQIYEILYINKILKP
jgi:3'-phosphoadenosine 5'-phosphosulfate sulfotransferase